MIRITFFLILTISLNAHAESFIGNFIAVQNGEKILLTLNKEGSGVYSGHLNIEGENISFAAKKQGQELTGKMTEEGISYQFVAFQQGKQLIFNFDNGTTIIFNQDTIENYQVSKSGSSASAAKPKNTSDIKRGVYVNGKNLTVSQAQQLESIYQTTVVSGRYWYDKKCGAWGVEGGPTAGFIKAGLNLPGPMPANSSGGGTGIFINGREIHPLDQKGLQQLFGITYQGRYWLDDQGNLGIENGPFIVNIVVAIQNAQSHADSGSVTHGYGSGYGSRGTLGGGMYSGRTASGKSVFWYPGM